MNKIPSPVNADDSRYNTNPIKLFKSFQEYAIIITSFCSACESQANCVTYRSLRDHYNNGQEDQSEVRGKEILVRLNPKKGLKVLLEDPIACIKFIPRQN